MSIVIIGVGDGDFGDMVILDGDDHRLGIDGTIICLSGS